MFVSIKVNNRIIGYSSIFIPYRLNVDALWPKHELVPFLLKVMPNVKSLGHVNVVKGLKVGIFKQTIQLHSPAFFHNLLLWGNAIIFHFISLV